MTSVQVEFQGDGEVISAEADVYVGTVVTSRDLVLHLRVPGQPDVRVVLTPLRELLLRDLARQAVTP